MKKAGIVALFIAGVCAAGAATMLALGMTP
jgi:hypothetical protein